MQAEALSRYFPAEQILLTPLKAPWHIRSHVRHSIQPSKDTNPEAQAVAPVEVHEEPTGQYVHVEEPTTEYEKVSQGIGLGVDISGQ
jgi:hypothetical protein